MKKLHPLPDTLGLGGLIRFAHKLLVDVDPKGAQFWIHLRGSDRDKPVSRAKIDQHIIVAKAGNFQHASYTLDSAWLEKGKSLLCLRYGDREQSQGKQKRRE